MSIIPEDKNAKRTSRNTVLQYYDEIIYIKITEANFCKKIKKQQSRRVIYR